MKSLQIRETPETIYNIVKKAAETEGRSMSQQALFFLAKGAEVSLNSREQRKKLIQNLVPFKISSSFKVQDLIAEDRKR